ncbi:MAG: cyanophycin synthetase, partial [Flammeovirgaceae bacterium]|nr:cyanophycin synthetase [Flammeovirgaceae bacterium]
PDKRRAIVDYAHTPDALQKVLETIGKMKQPQQRVITVVGCGGNRDMAKRPLMATIAAEMSDLAIFTSDNPRNEPPESIIAQMEQGLSDSLRKKTLSILDRRQAIRQAVTLAQPNDIILVAGKGHETYQEINGVRSYFDDKEELMRALNLN